LKKNIVFIVIFLGAFSSCSKNNEEKYATPSDAIITLVSAMDRQDSVTALNSLSTSYRETIMKRGFEFKFIFDVFKDIRQSVEVVSVDSISTDSVKVFISELLTKNSIIVKRDSCFYDVVREKGEWRVGELSARGIRRLN
jgi:hypothetical protein